MHPEDLPDPGTYVDPETGDIWEKHFSGKWYVNGLLHKPFPHSLTPEQRERQAPAVSIDDAVREERRVHQFEEEWRAVAGYPKYVVNRNGDIHHLESNTIMAPSMQDRDDSYYPLLDENNRVHLVSIRAILNITF